MTSLTAMHYTPQFCPHNEEFYRLDECISDNSFESIRKAGYIFIETKLLTSKFQICV